MVTPRNFKDVTQVIPGTGSGSETCLFLLMSTQTNSMVLVLLSFMNLSSRFNVIEFSCPRIYS